MPVLTSPREQRGSGVSLAVCLSAVIDPPGRGGIQPHPVLPRLPFGKPDNQTPIRHRLKNNPIQAAGCVAAASLGGANQAMTWVWASPLLPQLDLSSGLLEAALVWLS